MRKEVERAEELRLVEQLQFEQTQKLIEDGVRKEEGERQRAEEEQRLRRELDCIRINPFTPSPYTSEFGGETKRESSMAHDERVFKARTCTYSQTPSTNSAPTTQGPFSSLHKTLNPKPNTRNTQDPIEKTCPKASILQN